MSALCEQVEAFLSGELPASERPAFEAHWSGCENCRPRVTAWRSFSTAYQARAEAVSEPPAEPDVQRLLRKLRTWGEPRTRRAWAWGLGVALAAAAAALFVFLRTAAPVEPPVPEVWEASAAAPGLQVEGDRLTASPGSVVRVVRHDHSVTRLRLERGSLTAQVAKKKADQSFAIESYGVEVVVVGTRFSVTRIERAVRVDVDEGVVRVLHAGQENRVEKGGTITIETEPPPPTPQEATGAPDAGPVAVEPARLPMDRWRAASLTPQCAKVLPEIRRAAAANPRRADVWRVYGDCARKTSAGADAATAYEHYTRIASPDDADSIRPILADLYRSLSKPAEAERVLRTFLKRKQPALLEASARVTLARMFIDQGRTADARRELEYVVNKLPKTARSPEAAELLKTLP